MNIISNLISRFSGQVQSPSAPEIPKFNRLDFYKESYYKEVERRNSLNNEITLQGTVLIALISGVYILLTSFENPISCAVLFFNFFVLVELTLITGTGYYLLHSYYKFSKGGRESTFLPKLQTIDNYFWSCKGHQNPNEFEDFLIEKFIELSDQIRITNNEKSEDLTKSSRWMTQSFAGAAFILFCFLVNYSFKPYITKDDKSSNKEIVNNEQRQQSIQPGAAKSAAIPAAKPDTTPAGRTSTREKPTGRTSN